MRRLLFPELVAEGPRRAGPAAPARRARTPEVVPRGFTLAELIVALVLLTIGLGALAASGVWIARETAASGRAERAAILARSRLELLRLAPCTGASAVVDHGDLTERWAVSVEDGRATALVSVVARGGGRMREQRYRSAFAC